MCHTLYGQISSYDLKKIELTVKRFFTFTHFKFRRKLILTHISFICFVGAEGPACSESETPDIHRTGAKCVEGGDTDPLGEGKDYHTVGAFRLE